jgi:tetratricopeptide (TPR) repeat protein
MDDAVRLDPNSLDALMERAMIAQKLDQPEQCLTLLRTAVERFGFVKPLNGYINVLTQFGRADEARAYLDELARAHPGDLDIAVARARQARRQGDLPAARERWAEARAIFQYCEPAYQEAIDCLREIPDEAAAEALSREAITEFPDKPWARIVFARLAHDRQEWAEAAARWDEVCQRFPDETEAPRLRAAARKAAGG